MELQNSGSPDTNLRKLCLDRQNNAERSGMGHDRGAWPIFGKQLTESFKEGVRGVASLSWAYATLLCMPHCKPDAAASAPLSKRTLL